MKKIPILAASLLVLAGCYDDYMMDYEYSAAYITYQYDLRTFVYGEDNAVGFTVCLGGVRSNDRDRNYQVSFDNTLLTRDLSEFDTTGEIAGFTAMDGFMGTAPLGLLSNGYVTKAFTAAKVTAVEPLPESYYKVSGLDNGVAQIKKGRHTAEIMLTPTDELFADAKALAPNYALGIVINDADVDRKIADRLFQVMAVKVENKFFGNWYHGGRVQVRNNKSGELLSDDYKSLLIPQADANVCALTTETINSSLANKAGHQAGTLKLEFAEDNTITVSDPTGSTEIRPISGQPSHFNGAKLLQDREIYLNYAYANGNGTTTYVTDTLKFRNRVRDGFNEWQDENTENYK